MHCGIKEKGEWEIKRKNKQQSSQCEGYVWCQNDNGKMGNDYKQEEEIKKGMLEGTKTPHNHWD